MEEETKRKFDEQRRSRKKKVHDECYQKKLLEDSIGRRKFPDDD